MQELKEWFEAFSKIGQLPDGGYYRGAYTPEETEQQRLLTLWMKDSGLTVKRDAAGNLWGTVEGSNPNALPIVTGSHTDSVRSGGNYDGVFGVLGSLMAVKMLIKEHGKPKIPIQIAAFTGEEGSRFSIGLMGSHAAAGTLDKTTFAGKTDAAGVTASEALAAIGLDINKLDEAYHGELGAYLEMHIEQGPVLEEKGLPVGIVDSIVGTQQFRVTIHGEAGHAGTVPMANRKDPMVYAARAIERFPEIAKATGDGVITVGRIWSMPDAENVIPREVCFTVDLRHPNEEIKQEMVKAVKAVCEEEARPSGKPITWVPFPNNIAIAMDQQLKSMIVDSCNELGYPYITMPSGAGHDTLNMVKLGKVAMFFIPCEGGRSHCPEEHVKFDDIIKGVELMKKCIYHLAYEDCLGLGAK